MTTNIFQFISLHEAGPVFYVHNKCYAGEYQKLLEHYSLPLSLLKIHPELQKDLDKVKETARAHVANNCEGSITVSQRHLNEKLPKNAQVIALVDEDKILRVATRNVPTLTQKCSGYYLNLNVILTEDEKEEILKGAIQANNVLDNIKRKLPVGLIVNAETVCFDGGEEFGRYPYKSRTGEKLTGVFTTIFDK